MSANQYNSAESGCGKAEIVSISLKPRQLDEILSILKTEAAKGGDLLLLPETCLGNDIILETEGSEVAKVAEIAAMYGIYIVFPVYRKTAKCQRLNSSILINRKGGITGIYDKAYPYWSEFDLAPPATPGENIPVFDTDFGKIGLAVCFDANFPVVFRLLSDGGARLVLWSSAYSAGTSLQAHALNHNYMIISSTMTPDCAVYDINGREIFYQQGGVADIFVSRVFIDLDRCIFHQNFNMDKMKKLLQDHAGEVEMDTWLEREQ